jgi:uncharacterized protein YndB with AHSA1/START domain
MAVEFELQVVLPATPEAIYAAWLDSKQHAAMTGGTADVSDKVGEGFTAWDGYIRGTNLELEPHRRIVQAWRTVEFSDAEADSRLEIKLAEAQGGTQLTLRHNGLPEHGEQYRQGWMDNYFEPMRDFFEAS